MILESRIIERQTRKHGYIRYELTYDGTRPSRDEIAEVQANLGYHPAGYGSFDTAFHDGDEPRRVTWKSANYSG